MGFQRLCFVAALSATLSIGLCACNGGGMSGIPTTSGIPDAGGDNTQMPQPDESMTPAAGGSEMPQPSGTPVVIAPNNPMMPPQQLETAEPQVSPAEKATPEPQPSVKPSAPIVKTVSLAIRLNDKKIPPGSYVWFASTFALRTATPATFKMHDSQVTLAGHTYGGPAGVVAITPGASKPAITFKNNTISSTYPPSASKKAFMNGVIVYLPSGLPARQTATWSARFESSKTAFNGASMKWQATATAYSHFSSSYGSLRVDSNGTPQSFVRNRTPGVSSAGAATSVTVCPCP